MVATVDIHFAREIKNAHCNINLFTGVSFFIKIIGLTFYLYRNDRTKTKFVPKSSLCIYSSPSL